MNISGLIMCVLYYGQLSSFATMLSDGSQPSVSAWVSKVTQFGSIFSLYDSACYGVDMGAYEATAAQLCGPTFVLAATLLLNAAGHWLLPKFNHVLQKHHLHIRISLRATLINVLLLLFSSVSSVVFQLITCQQVGAERVIFIDGTKKCEGPLYGGMSCQLDSGFCSSSTRFLQPQNSSFVLPIPTQGTIGVQFHCFFVS